MSTRSQLGGRPALPPSGRSPPRDRAGPHWDRPAQRPLELQLAPRPQPQHSGTSAEAIPWNYLGIGPAAAAPCSSAPKCNTRSRATMRPLLHRHTGYNPLRFAAAESLRPWAEIHPSSIVRGIPPVPHKSNTTNDSRKIAHGYLSATKAAPVTSSRRS